MTIRDEAATLKAAINAAALEAEGLHRGQIGAAMLGIGGAMLARC
jgi:hypothetical protein